MTKSQLRPQVHVTEDGSEFVAGLFLNDAMLVSSKGATEHLARVNALRAYREMLTATVREVSDMIEVELEAGK